MVDVLLKDGAEPLRAAARRLFENPNLKTFSESADRARVLRRFADSKIPDAYEFYLAMLDIKGNKLGDTTYRMPVAETSWEWTSRRRHTPQTIGL